MFAPQAGLRTVGPLVLDITAAAAAPKKDFFRVKVASLKKIKFSLGFLRIK